MPPVRTIMPPAKVLKTERTHEENQERAYIAASRRSDRSLEARVESARRASEIHKRRTGRSLRVTEQDVVNEEMYEEEDDDLPMQYRRLTAHLQTGSADFNRRLSAYLTNHVAMRSALDQAITNSYAQQYPHAPQFAHNQNFFPSPFAQGQPDARSPHSVYSQPYPTPGTPGYRPNYHARRAPPSAAQSVASYPPPGAPPTPSSAPGSAISTGPPDQRHASHSSKASSHSPVQQRSSIPRTPHLQEVNGHVVPEAATDAPQKSPYHEQANGPSLHGYASLSPLTMALPMESQMFLNGALDPNDPMTSALMAGSHDVPAGYPCGGSEHPKSRSMTYPFGGMSTTLAPSALDMQPRQHDFSQQQAPDSMRPSSGLPSDLGFGYSDIPKGTLFPSSQESQASGAATPGLDAGWDAFINDGSWNETSVT